jgi:hypothetical protein
VTRRVGALVLGLLWAAGCASTLPPPPGPPPRAATPLPPAPLPPPLPPGLSVPPPEAIPPPPAPPEAPPVPAPPAPAVVVPEPAPPAPPPPPITPDPALADARLAALVEQRLAADPMLQTAVIEAEAQDGQVTLKGTVPTFRERARAIEVALQVPGVRSVRPRLVLQAP